MKKLLRCSFLTLLIFCVITSPASAEDENITFDEAGRRFALKKDFILFQKLWRQKHIKYHSSFDYSPDTELLTLYDQEKNVLAAGKAKKEGNRYIRYGYWRRFYTNGALLGRINYSNNRRNGTATGFYQNGKIAIKAEYTDGLYDKQRKRYDSSGRLLDTVTFSNGKALSYEISTMLVPSLQRPNHLPFGTVYEKGHDVWVHRDKDNNFITMWYRNGSLLCELTGLHVGKKDEVLEGKAVYWHENGSKWMEGQYSNGRQSGKWVFYSEDGSIKEETASDLEYIFGPDNQ